jgi:flagella basal body P-ring formation protein FlgA
VIAMLHALALLAVLFAAPPAAAAEPEAPPLRLRAQAAVPGTRILLADLVEEDQLALLSEELRAADLGRAPSPGFGRRFTAEEIAALVAPAGAVAFEAAGEVIVTGDVATVGADAVVAAAEAFLRAHPALPAAALIETPRPPRDVQVPRGRDSRELVPRLRHAPRGALRGQVALNVEVQVDGKLQVIVPLVLLVRTFADVPVLCRAVPRGETLRESDVAAQRIETTELTALPPSDVASLLGLTARHDLREGNPLDPADFEMPVLVRRNDSVTLVFAKGGLRAESFGIARDSGTLGETVRVENLSTKKVVIGRVAGRGLVNLSIGALGAN